MKSTRDISVVFTIKDNLAYIQAFLESIRAIEPGEIVAIVSGDKDDPTFIYLDSQQDVVAYPIYCNRGKRRNLAIEHSTTPYVLMVDADNRYDFSRMDFAASKEQYPLKQEENATIHLFASFSFSMAIVGSTTALIFFK